MEVTKPNPSPSEGPIWNHLDARWRVVHGGIHEGGASIEFHDFALSTPFEWDATFHDRTLEICINLHGEATIRRGADIYSIRDNEVAIYTIGPVRPRARRLPGGHHCFYTLELSCAWLRKHLGESRDRLRPEILRFIERPARARSYVEVRPLPPAMIPMRIDLLAPPVPDAARDAWYFGKLFEVLALTSFEQPSSMSSVDRRKRERIEHARARLDESFENPPSLQELSREAGCSTFHLSRMFKEECGVSISTYLRALRMEKGAEHLRQGKSVTEAAMAVGYSNVSAFIEAFRLHHCTTPSKWAALWKSDSR